eukprot:scaffold250731_cov21-Tisochrysis_lutea.AAC.1
MGTVYTYAVVLLPVRLNCCRASHNSASGLPHLCGCLLLCISCNPTMHIRTEQMCNRATLSWSGVSQPSWYLLHRLLLRALKKNRLLSMPIGCPKY